MIILTHKVVCYKVKHTKYIPISDVVRTFFSVFPKRAAEPPSGGGRLSQGQGWVGSTPSRELCKKKRKNAKTRLQNSIK